MLIGEQIHLTLHAEFPSNEPINFFNVDSIPHFEILQRPKTDTAEENNKIVLKQVLTLTSFDSGHWVIPSLSLLNGVNTDTIPVDIGFSSFDPNQNYHDIKDVINVQLKEEKKKQWYVYVIAAALVVTSLGYLILKKRKKFSTEKKPSVDPYREAKLELEKLRKEDLLQKIFYTKLADIFRLYIFRRKEIASLQETTDELVQQIRTLKLGDENYNQLVQALRTTDFVKFAKYEPEEKTRMETFNIINRSIDLIENLTENPSTHKKINDT